MADEAKSPLTREEFLHDLRNKLSTGKAVEREAALIALGDANDIAWWDDEPMWLPMPEPIADLLAPGALMMCEPDAIMPEVWQRHRFNRDHGGHGLKLADNPKYVAVYRNKAGDLRLMVGYTAA